MKRTRTVAVLGFALLAAKLAFGFTQYSFRTRLFVVERDTAFRPDGKGGADPFLIVAGDLGGRAEAQKAFLANLFGGRAVALRAEGRAFDWDVETKVVSEQMRRIIIPRLAQVVEIGGSSYEIRIAPKAEENRISGYEISMALRKSAGGDGDGPVAPMAALFDETAGGRIFREEVKRPWGAFFIVVPGDKEIFVVALNIDLSVGGPI